MICNFFALLVFGAALFNQALAVPCNCGLGRGVNVCSGQGDIDNLDEDGKHPGDNSFYPLVVRPQTLSKVEISEMTKPGTATYEKILTGESKIAPLKPIGGDVCSCGRTIVTPAYVPKPACSGCSGGRSGSTSLLEQAASATLEQTLHGTASSSSNLRSTGQTEDVGGIVVDFPMCGLPVVPSSRPVYYGSQVPADAVSRALALQQLQSKQYAVDHEVQYGFKTMPKEEVIHHHKRKHLFAEDNVYRHNGDILELGNIYHAPSVDETAITDLEEEEEPEIEVEPIKVQPITLGALGFIPTHNPKTHFTNVAVPEPHVHISSPSCGVEPVSHCNDGYRGGQVIIKEEPIHSEAVHSSGTTVEYSGEEGRSRYIEEPDMYSYSANPSHRGIGSIGDGGHHRGIGSIGDGGHHRGIGSIGDGGHHRGFGSIGDEGHHRGIGSIGDGGSSMSSSISSSSRRSSSSRSSSSHNSYYTRGSCL